MFSLPYNSDYTATPTSQNTGELSTYTSKLSFLTVTSITGDSSPFHNISRKFNLGYNFVLSKTIHKPIICLIVT